ncbi:hypothetical protein [Kurthia senegalensis]|uniref:hypothetical protein n=1 Tax=Kurthia senegalensis TaxID=1033740 RepID=UPI003898EC51
MIVVESTPHPTLSRYYTSANIVVLFEDAIENPGEVDELLVVSNGQFDITLKVKEATVISSVAPDMLHLRVENVFSYTSHKPFTKKQIHQLQTSLLNEHNIHIRNDAFPYDKKSSAQIFFGIL